jgi:hypothetical protein
MAVFASRPALGADSEHALLTLAGQKDDALLSFVTGLLRHYEANGPLIGLRRLDAEIDGFLLLRRVSGRAQKETNRQGQDNAQCESAERRFRKRTSGHRLGSPFCCWSALRLVPPLGRQIEQSKYR